MTNKPMLSERDKFEVFWRKEMSMLKPQPDPHAGSNAMLILGGGILLMIAIGLPQLGWSPVMYGGSAMCFAAFLK